MTICEKCWGEAHIRHLNDPSKSQTEHYMDIIKEKKHPNGENKQRD